MRLAAFILLVTTWLVATPPLEACQRCGCFGRSCKFVRTRRVVVPVVKKIVRETQPIIIFNNAGYAAQQGQTAYAPPTYQSYAADYRVQAPDYFREAFKLTSAAQQLAAQGQQGLTDSYQATLQYNAAITDLQNRSATAALALQAVSAPAAGGAGAAVTTQQSSGAWKITQNVEGATEVAQLPTPPLESGAGLSDYAQLAERLVASRCASCHVQQDKGGLNLSQIGDPAFAASPLGDSTVIERMLVRVLGECGPEPGKPPMPFDGPRLTVNEMAIIFSYAGALVSSGQVTLDN